MCNCLTDLAKPEFYGLVKKSKVTNVELPTALVVDEKTNQLSVITLSVAMISIEGKKTLQKVSLYHTYCPFCGQRYCQAEPPVNNSLSNVSNEKPTNP